MTSKGVYQDAKNLLLGGAVFVSMGVFWIILGTIVLWWIAPDLSGGGANTFALFILALLFITSQSVFIMLGIQNIYLARKARSIKYEEGNRFTVSFLPYKFMNGMDKIGYVAFIEEEHVCSGCGMKICGAQPKFCPKCGHSFS
jgi:hypothetical protein